MRTVTLENVAASERQELENKRGMVFLKLEAPKVAKEGTRPAILFFEEIDNHRGTLHESEVAQIWDAICQHAIGNHNDLTVVVNRIIKRVFGVQEDAE